MTDQELLSAYTQRRDEAAFREIVIRYMDVVYGAARRQVCDPGMADDVAQAVFLVLARRAGAVRNTKLLGAWLLKVTQFCAAEARRSAARRRRYEEGAATMMKQDTVEDGGTRHAQLADYLDAALNKLRAGDRTALVLRYLQEKTLAEVGRSLGTSEESAKKRVARALERLRKLLAKKGVAMPAALLAVAVSKEAIAAPAGLVDAACSAALAKGIAATSLPAIIAHLATRLMWKATARIAATIAVTALGGGLLVGELARADRSAAAAPAAPASPAPAAPAIARKMTLDQLIIALEERSVAVKSIEWTATLDIGVENGKPKSTILRAYGRQGDWEFLSEPQPGQPTTVHVSDGQTRFLYEPNRLLEINAQPFGRETELPNGLMGIYVWGGVELLPLLRKGGATLSPEMVMEDGAPCYEIQGIAQARSTTGDTDATFRILLDPARSLMPRRIEQRFSDTRQPVQVVDHFEYVEVLPGKWFPSAARQRGFSRDAAGEYTHLLVTNEIHAKVTSINQDIPPERFAIDAPAGITTVDMSLIPKPDAPPPDKPGK